MKAKLHDIELFYETLGNGFPVMLMHGVTGFDHTYFRPWLDPLSENNLLIYYDHRGNGRSAMSGTFENFDASAWVSDVDELRRYLGYEKIVLLGHSTGGFVAQEYALKFGERLAGLILCNSMPAFDYPEVMMSNARARATQDQLNAIVKAFTEKYDNDTFKELTAEILPVYFKHYKEDYGRRFVENMWFNSKAAYYCSSTLFPSFSTINRLHEIKVPTLIICGKDDWITPLAEGSERLHAGIQGSELMIFEESGHFPFIEEQTGFLSIVGAWFDNITRR